MRFKIGDFSIQDIFVRETMKFDNMPFDTEVTKHKVNTCNKLALFIQNLFLQRTADT